MTGPVQTSLEKTEPRPPVLSECQSDSSGGNMHELATAGRARTVFRTPSVFISIYISMCVSLALRHTVCLYVHLTVRRLFYTTIVRSSRPLDNRKSGRVVRT